MNASETSAGPYLYGRYHVMTINKHFFKQLHVHQQLHITFQVCQWLLLILSGQ